MGAGGMSNDRQRRRPDQIAGQDVAFAATSATALAAASFRSL